MAEPVQERIFIVRAVHKACIDHSREKRMKWNIYLHPTRTRGDDAEPAFYCIGLSGNDCHEAYGHLNQSLEEIQLTQRPADHFTGRGQKRIDTGYQEFQIDDIFSDDPREILQFFYPLLDAWKNRPASAHPVMGVYQQRAALLMMGERGPQFLTQRTALSLPQHGDGYSW